MRNLKRKLGTFSPYIVKILPYFTFIYFCELLNVSVFFTLIFGKFVSFVLSFLLMLALTFLVFGLYFLKMRARVFFLFLSDFYVAIIFPVSLVRIINANSYFYPIVRLIFCACLVVFIYCLTDENICKKQYNI